MLLAELAESQWINGAFEMKVQFGLGKTTDEIALFTGSFYAKNLVWLPEVFGSGLPLYISR